MKDQLSARLASLKRELELGQTKLHELERQQNSTRDTLLRISGAIQVLEEALAEPSPSTGNGAPAPSDQRTVSA